MNEKNQSAMRGFTRTFVTCALVATQIGCARSQPPATPISVQPTVDAQRVPESFEFFFGADPDRFAAVADERLKPNNLSVPAKQALEMQRGHGYRVLVCSRFERSGQIFCGEKIERGFVGVVLPRSTAGHVIVPVDWVRRVVTIRGGDETAVHDWCVALIERLATAGLASGIALLPNGDAIGVEIDLKEKSGPKLVARVKKLRAGEYFAAEWGPSIRGDGVATASMNGPDGISIEDLFREQLTPKAVTYFTY